MVQEEGPSDTVPSLRDGLIALHSERFSGRRQAGQKIQLSLDRLAASFHICSYTAPRRRPPSVRRKPFSLPPLATSIGVLRAAPVEDRSGKHVLYMLQRLWLRGRRYSELAGKWRRKPLKGLISRRELVVAGGWRPQDIEAASAAIWIGSFIPDGRKPGNAAMKRERQDRPVCGSTLNRVASL
jgi:hypothetical protein